MSDQPVGPQVLDAEYLDVQRTFSEHTFGPYPRVAGVVDHIEKELGEIEDDPENLEEWVDLIILGFDGACGTGASSQEIIDAVWAKLRKNMERRWPDWRTADRTKAIEHDRTGE